MSTKELLITPKMYAQAKGNKSIGHIMMSPMDFLKLSTPGNTSTWISEEKSYTKTLDEYNGFAKEGTSILPPWLDIAMDTGKVLGHEGRHRAMAVMNAGGTKFPVFIVLKEGSEGSHSYWSVYYKESRPDDGRWVKRYLGKKDIPLVWTGQFNSANKVKVDLSTFEGFYGENK